MANTDDAIVSLDDLALVLVHGGHAAPNKLTVDDFHPDALKKLTNPELKDRYHGIAGMASGEVIQGHAFLCGEFRTPGGHCSDRCTYATNNAADEMAARLGKKQ